MLSTILAAMIGFYFGAKTDSGVASPRGDQATADRQQAIKDLDAISDRLKKLEEK